MSDIVERLREKSEWTNQRPYFHAHDKCIEAAAEITRLRAELTEARDGSHNLYASREYAEHTSQARKHRNEIETLEAVRAILKEQDDAR